MKHRSNYTNVWGVVICLTGLLALSSCQSESKKTNQQNSEVKNESMEHATSPAISFKLHSEQTTGIGITNKLPEAAQMNILNYQYFHNGAGVAVGDLDNDSLPDLYFTGNLIPNQVYKNKGGFVFENLTKTAGIDGGLGWCTGVTMVDINSDGLLDVYVCKSGNLDESMRRNMLYVNKGNFEFEERAAEYGLDDPSYSTQAYFFDYDRDGDLDMFLLNHNIVSISGYLEALDFDKRHPLAGDKLYENRNGKYVDVSQQMGIRGNEIGYGLSASIGDFNNDGYPDIYVCNDYVERDYLYFNHKGEKFKDMLFEKTKHISNFSMGSDVSDINNDGYEDLFVVDMAAEDNYRSKANMSGMDQAKFESFVAMGLHYQYMINTLQVNNGDGSFSECAQLSGLDKTDWSWSALFMDMDNDGFKDVFVTNGLRKDIRNNDYVKKKNKIITEAEQKGENQEALVKKIISEIPEQKIPNVWMRNMGNSHFEKQKSLDFEVPSFSNGAAYADLDLDGDLDVVISNIDHPSFIYENQSPANNYLNITFSGGAQNTAAIGAVVQLICGDQQYKSAHYITRGYQSSSENKLHFGLGSITKVDSVKVEWPDGKRSLYTDVPVNQDFNVSQGNFAQWEFTYPGQKVQLAQKNVGFVHNENDYDDFAREVLLPHKMSQLGPSLAVADVNGDGLDDVYIGGALGQNGKLYIQSKTGGSFHGSQVVYNNKKVEETVAEFFDYDNDGDMDLYLGMGSNEAESYQDVLLENENGKFSNSRALPAISISTGAVTAFDYDADGDLDLFVGGRQIPGKYPHPAASLVLENRNNTYVDVTASVSTQFEELGMVTSATWKSLNAEESPYLFVTGEWMPIRVFAYQNNAFVEVSDSLGFHKSNGWWNDVQMADIDNDGDLDMVAGNLGLNYKYKAKPGYPFGLFYGDLNQDGKSDIVLSYEQNGDYYPLRGRQCSSEQMPEIKQKFPSYHTFAKSTVFDVYAGQLDSNKLLLSYDFSSALFINENGMFKRQNFDHPHQSFPWKSVIVTDINQDNKVDIIAAGNIYESEVETPRADAGTGLILAGNGSGGFTELKSNLPNWGDANVRNLKLINLGGKPAFLVASSNDKLKAFTLDYKP